ncbi:type I pullulanase [Priestia koreensis]|uniref:type I pullulanase n=1 Tax=Priestia koreensis TaxID=284581 RepID=UPI0034584E26
MNVTKREYEAYLDTMDTVTILVPYEGEMPTAFFLMERNEQIQLPIARTIHLPTMQKYECITTLPIEIGKPYEIIDSRSRRTDLQIGAVIRTPEFDQLFFYTGSDLGVTLTDTETIFKLWAPSAIEAKVKLLHPETKEEKMKEMVRGEKGVWTWCEPQDLDGCLYTYLVRINGTWAEAVDPYARALTANSEYGMIINLTRSTQPIAPRPALAALTDAIIYETHIRDFSISPHSGIKAKGTYHAFTEENTTTSNGYSTGVSYLKELGVTHIELLPVNDYGGVDEMNPLKEYNWGYNPLYFNVPEGSYSSNPSDGYTRVNELKKLISTLHQNGMRVILDVVYNHVYVRETSSFEKLVPGYYFRHDYYGMPSNGTGVGNDLASERNMVRKFIIDSISYWLTEFQVDGFRFDLMGILDIQTMNAIRALADKTDPTILLLGEGWDLNTPLPYDQKATLYNAEKIPGIAQFNDQFRDCVKGSTFNIYDRGYALGHLHRKNDVKQSLSGSVAYEKYGKYLFAEPFQSINYVESHDNHTLWDKMSKCNHYETDIIRQKRHTLATSMVLLAQGIPFLHSGQEFYRTKFGVENSYKDPDYINQLDWQRREKFDENIQFIQKLIRFRKQEMALRLPSRSHIQQHVRFLQTSEAVIAYHLTHIKEFSQWNDLLLAFNNDLKEQEFVLPDGNRWRVLLKDQCFFDKGEEEEVVSSYKVPPLSVLILGRE